MTPSAGGSLDARVVRRVHPGLTVDVSLKLGAEIGVLFGRSGAGKSTLLRLLAGLDRPDAGRVELAGEVLFDLRSGRDVPLRRRRVGMIFQDDLLFPHLDVRGNVGFGLRAEPRRDRERRVAEVASAFGIEHLIDRRIETLSGGERQRVGLARALAPRPRLLLCDEPVSALDLGGRRTLLDRLRDVPRVEGVPVLYVTHSPAEAVTLGTRLFLMEAGRIAAEGPPAEVLAGSARAEFSHLEGVRNVFSGRIAEHEDGGEWTRLALDDGPSLVVAPVAAPVGSRVAVEVDGDDVLLALGPIAGLSARNQVEGTVEAIAIHGREAEVLVRVGGLRWLVSTLGSTPAELGLAPGRSVRLIVKARSVRVEASPG